MRQRDSILESLWFYFHPPSFVSPTPTTIGIQHVVNISTTDSVRGQGPWFNDDSCRKTIVVTRDHQLKEQVTWLLLINLFIFHLLVSFPFHPRALNAVSINLFVVSAFQPSTRLPSHLRLFKIFPSTQMQLSQRLLLFKKQLFFFLSTFCFLQIFVVLVRHLLLLFLCHLCALFNRTHLVRGKNPIRQVQTQECMMLHKTPPESWRGSPFWTHPSQSVLLPPRLLRCNEIQYNNRESSATRRTKWSWNNIAQQPGQETCVINSPKQQLLAGHQENGSI